MTAPTVCILTAGKGTRLRRYGQALNKALLPIDGRATLSQIIRRFPPGSHFVIGLGHLGQQVRDYVAMAHPDLPVTFVEIDRYEGPGTGPGYSLICCKPHLLKPFYFVSCDTLWDGDLDFDRHDDWLGVAAVPPEDTPRYCNLKVDDDRVLDLRDKERVGPEYRAFVGLCHIASHDVFWRGLESKDMVGGELQVSNGLRLMIAERPVHAMPIVWTDVGTEEAYKAAVQRYEDYDFSKVGEAFYSSQGRVIKFFEDPQATAKRVAKARLRPGVFPQITHHLGQFYAYAYQPGRTMYEHNDPLLFERFLSWLDQNLWMPHEVSAEEMRKACLAFYRDKTLSRLRGYAEKAGIGPEPSRVNGVDLPSTSVLLERVDWNAHAAGVPAFMHGDLQFDNIIYDAEQQRFCLLDWRQDFAGHVEFGDLYYDLAKLLGGIWLNYDLVKKNLLTYRETPEGAWLDFPQRLLASQYEAVLERHVAKKGLDFQRVKQMVGLIYLNMAPLHHAPFDRGLHALGRLVLHTGTPRP